MIRLATLAILAPAAALAHAGPEGHAHPHGAEGIALAVLLAAAGWAAWRALR